MLSAGSSHAVARTCLADAARAAGRRSASTTVLASAAAGLRRLRPATSARASPLHGGSHLRAPPSAAVAASCHRSPPAAAASCRLSPLAVAASCHHLRLPAAANALPASTGSRTQSTVAGHIHARGSRIRLQRARIRHSHLSIDRRLRRPPPRRRCSTSNAEEGLPKDVLPTAAFPAGCAVSGGWLRRRQGG
uniref:Uncharacterized protein n=1 Tax=Oryza meridionalis TaxID=40149 RepID=A0A0E0EAJ4_9ORYZ